MALHHMCPEEVVESRRDAIKALPADVRLGLWAWGALAKPSCDPKDTTPNIVLDEASGMWLLDNGEYSAPITFCPWCGERL